MSKSLPRKKKLKKVYTGLGAEELRAFIVSLRQKKYSPATLRIRQRAVMDLCGYLKGQGCERLADVNLNDLDGYRGHIVERGFNSNSVNSYLWSVRKFFDFLEETQRIFSNPSKGLKIPALNRSLQPVPTEAEMTQLLSGPDMLKSTGTRDRAILEVMYATGVRQGELLRMKIFDPDFERGIIRVMGKGSKERIVPLGKHALHWLRQYMRQARLRLIKKKVDEQALWVSKDGYRLSGIRVDQMIREYAKKAGIKKKVSAHSLRRACATHMLMGGAHPVQLQMLLGHSSLQTLSQYVRKRPTNPSIPQG